MEKIDGDDGHHAEKAGTDNRETDGFIEGGWEESNACPPLGEGTDCSSCEISCCGSSIYEESIVDSVTMPYGVFSLSGTYGTCEERSSQTDSPQSESFPNTQTEENISSSASKLSSANEKEDNNNKVQINRVSRLRRIFENRFNVNREDGRGSNHVPQCSSQGLVARRRTKIEEAVSKRPGFEVNMKLFRHDVPSTWLELSSGSSSSSSCNTDVSEGSSDCLVTLPSEGQSSPGIQNDNSSHTSSRSSGSSSSSSCNTDLSKGSSDCLVTLPSEGEKSPGTTQRIEKDNSSHTSSRSSGSSFSSSCNTDLSKGSSDCLVGNLQSQRFGPGWEAFMQKGEGTIIGKVVDTDLTAHSSDIIAMEKSPGTTQRIEKDNSSRTSSRSSGSSFSSSCNTDLSKGSSDCLVGNLQSQRFGPGWEAFMQNGGGNILGKVVDTDLTVPSSNKIAIENSPGTTQRTGYLATSSANKTSFNSDFDVNNRLDQEWKGFISLDNSIDDVSLDDSNNTESIDPRYLSDIESSIEAGDWKAVGETAALMGDASATTMSSRECIVPGSLSNIGSSIEEGEWKAVGETALMMGDASTTTMSSGECLYPRSLSDLGSSIEGGDWKAVGQTAAMMSGASATTMSSGEIDRLGLQGFSDRSISSCESRSMGEGISEARAAALDEMIDREDWSAVVQIAYGKEFDLRQFVPSVPPNSKVSFATGDEADVETLRTQEKSENLEICDETAYPVTKVCSSNTIDPKAITTNRPEEFDEFKRHWEFRARERAYKAFDDRLVGSLHVTEFVYPDYCRSEALLIAPEVQTTRCSSPLSDTLMDKYSPVAETNWNEDVSSDINSMEITAEPLASTECETLLLAKCMESFDERATDIGTRTEFQDESGKNEELDNGHHVFQNGSVDYIQVEKMTDSIECETVLLAKCVESFHENAADVGTGTELQDESGEYEKPENGNHVLQNGATDYIKVETLTDNGSVASLCMQPFEMHTDPDYEEFNDNPLVSVKVLSEDEGIECMRPDITFSLTNKQLLDVAVDTDLEGTIGAAEINASTCNESGAFSGKRDWQKTELPEVLQSDSSNLLCCFHPEVIKWTFDLD